MAACCVITSDTCCILKKTTLNRRPFLSGLYRRFQDGVTGERRTTQMRGGQLMWVCGAAGAPAPVGMLHLQAVCGRVPLCLSGFVVKHACICIHAHEITQTVALHLFSLNTCMQIPPPFFPSAEECCAPTRARRRAGSGRGDPHIRQTD